MADVFISYARGDMGFVERLAETLEGLGLSVWWDRKLQSGADWELRIEEELDAAKAVIVVWSKESVKSLPVRDEAREAQRQEKLAPISIESVQPPLFSRGIHFEDLSNWDGETSSFEFQDVWRQLIALRDGEEAASVVPRDGATPVRPVGDAAATGEAPGAEGLDPDAPVIRSSWLSRPIGPFSSFAKLLEFGFAIGGVAWLFFNRENLIGTYWNAVASAAIFFLVMFNAAEGSLSKNVKALVAQWLRPQPHAAPLRAAQAFLAMFEAVFSKRHFSARCFIASAIASVALYWGLLGLFVPLEILQRAFEDLIANGPRPLTATEDRGFNYVNATFLETNAALLFIAIPIANILVDYISLGQTRIVLRWAASGAPTPVAVAIDAVLTGALFVALLPLGPVAFALTYDALSGGVTPDSVERARLMAEEIWRALWTFVTVGFPRELQAAVAGEASVTSTSLLIAFLTTFTTSAWLWAALVFAPMVRLLSWGRRRGLSLLGAVLNTRARPIAPLGYMAAALILAGGGLASVGAQIAEMRLSSADAPFGSFRDCEACPIMVALPGGTFTMGSPDDEPGRDFDEGPQAEITIGAFAIGRYEVTFREWDACVAETAQLAPELRCRPIARYGEPADGDQGWGRGLRPAITISWYDTRPFLAWLNSKLESDEFVYRLPGEAEWEYAARAGSATTYPFQGELAKVGCLYMNGVDESAVRLNPDWTSMGCDDGYPFTAPIGTYRPNAFGLYDTHGNVWEWTEDCDNGSLENQPADGSVRTTGFCDDSNLRGGAWDGFPRGLRTAYRHRLDRTYRNLAFGFRVVRVPADRAATPPPEAEPTPDAVIAPAAE